MLFKTKMAKITALNIFIVHNLKGSCYVVVIVDFGTFHILHTKWNRIPTFILQNKWEDMLEDLNCTIDGVISKDLMKLIKHSLIQKKIKKIIIIVISKAKVHFRDLQ